MGSVAKTLFDKGGKVHGIIPRALIRREVVRRLLNFLLYIYK